MNLVLGVAAALAVTHRWIEHPPSVIRQPTSRHLELLSGLLASLGSGGNLVSDAHLAALALALVLVLVGW